MEEAIRGRLEMYWGKEEARIIFDYGVSLISSGVDEWWRGDDAPSELWDLWPDFFLSMPSKPHHKLLYLRKIILATQEALEKQRSACDEMLLRKV